MHVCALIYVLIRWLIMLNYAMIFIVMTISWIQAPFTTTPRYVATLHVFHVPLNLAGVHNTYHTILPICRRHVSIAMFSHHCLLPMLPWQVLVIRVAIAVILIAVVHLFFLDRLRAVRQCIRLAKGQSHLSDGLGDLRQIQQRALSHSAIHVFLMYRRCP